MSPQEKIIALKTLIRKEVVRFMRVWIQTLVPPAISMTLYFLIFGKMIGSKVGQIHGFSYIQYIAPGLIMMGVINSSFANTVSSFYMSKFQKSIEEMLVSPMPSFIILIGFVVGAMARGMMVGLIITIIALFFTELTIHSFAVMLSMVLLTSMLFALAGLINAIYAKTFDDISIIPTFVLTPLTYLGGVFYSVQSLPPGFYHFSMVNPILYMVNGFRYGILGVSDVDLGLVYTIVCGFTLVLFITASVLLKRGIGIRS